MAPTIGVPHTSQNRTTDGVIGTSGADSIVFQVIIQGGAAITVGSIEEGTAGSGTVRALATAPINDTVVLDFGDDGLFFDGGVYVDITTTGGSITVAYSQ